MSERPVILFMFAGRRPNMEINLPLFQRIVAEHPQVHFHIWDLARDAADAQYLRTIAGERIEVCRQFSGPRAPRYMGKVWQHYTASRYSEALFVKVDDDIAFVQTEHFGAFLDAIEAHPNHLISAEVVNNGACTAFIPALWQGFASLDIPLLDVHKSNGYAQLAHEHMLGNWRQLLARPLELADIETWLSINFIGMNWELLRRISTKLGRPSPEWIADRQWRAGSRIGDEGSANLLDRKVLRGFTVAHLGFGPQNLTPEQEQGWRDRYATVGADYLASVQKLNTVGGPA